METLSTSHVAIPTGQSMIAENWKAGDTTITSRKATVSRPVVPPALTLSDRNAGMLVAPSSKLLFPSVSTHAILSGNPFTKTDAFDATTSNAAAAAKQASTVAANGISAATRATAGTTATSMSTTSARTSANDVAVGATAPTVWPASSASSTSTFRPSFGVAARAPPRTTSPLRDMERTEYADRANKTLLLGNLLGGLLGGFQPEPSADATAIAADGPSTVAARAPWPSSTQPTAAAAAAVNAPGAGSSTVSTAHSLPLVNGVSAAVNDVGSDSGAASDGSAGLAPGVTMDTLAAVLQSQLTPAVVGAELAEESRQMVREYQHFSDRKRRQQLRQQQNPHNVVDTGSSEADSDADSSSGLSTSASSRFATDTDNDDADEDEDEDATTSDNDVDTNPSDSNGDDDDADEDDDATSDTDRDVTNDRDNSARLRASEAGTSTAVTTPASLVWPRASKDRGSLYSAATSHDTSQTLSTPSSVSSSVASWDTPTTDAAHRSGPSGAAAAAATVSDALAMRMSEPPEPLFLLPSNQPWVPIARATQNAGNFKHMVTHDMAMMSALADHTPTAFAAAPVVVAPNDELPSATSSSSPHHTPPPAHNRSKIAGGVPGLMSAPMLVAPVLSLPLASNRAVAPVPVVTPASPTTTASTVTDANPSLDSSSGTVMTADSSGSDVVVVEASHMPMAEMDTVSPNAVERRVDLTSQATDADATKDNGTVDSTVSKTSQDDGGAADTMFGLLCAAVPFTQPFMGTPLTADPWPTLGSHRFGQASAAASASSSQRLPNAGIYPLSTSVDPFGDIGISTTHSTLRVIQADGYDDERPSAFDATTVDTDIAADAVNVTALHDWTQPMAPVDSDPALWLTVFALMLTVAHKPALDAVIPFEVALRNFEVQWQNSIHTVEDDTSVTTGERQVALRQLQHMRTLPGLVQSLGRLQGNETQWGFVMQRLIAQATTTPGPDAASAAASASSSFFPAFDRDDARCGGVDNVANESRGVKDASVPTASSLQRASWWHNGGWADHVTFVFGVFLMVVALWMICAPMIVQWSTPLVASLPYPEAWLSHPFAFLRWLQYVAVHCLHVLAQWLTASFGLQPLLLPS